MNNFDYNLKNKLLWSCANHNLREGLSQWDKKNRIASIAHFTLGGLKTFTVVGQVVPCAKCLNPTQYQWPLLSDDLHKYELTKYLSRQDIKNLILAIPSMKRTLESDEATVAWLNSHKGRLDLLNWSKEKCLAFLERQGLRLSYLSLTGINLSFHEIKGLPEILHNLASLNLHQCKDANDEMILTIIQYCKKLKKLSLENCNNISSEGIKLVVQNCKNMEELNLGHLNVLSDEILSEIFKTSPKLRSLSLAGANISGEGFDQITHLTHLSLAFCEQIPVDRLEVILKNCPELEALTFYKIGEISGLEFAAIMKNAPKQKLVIPARMVKNAKKKYPKHKAIINYV